MELQVSTAGSSRPASEPLIPTVGRGGDSRGAWLASVEELGGVIGAVRAASPAARAGLQTGDRIVAIDGVVPRDLIDVQYQIDGRQHVAVDYLRDGLATTARVGFHGDLDLGIEFVEPTFDGLRQCNNNCEFCFIRGLPKGLRRTLYIRDDDYRYSFLFGNFLTLTNLDEDDWRRICYQRLSPLRVSVHATDPGVRARLLSHPGASPILPQLDRLGAAGIIVHAQVVLCPGLNDGQTLKQTVLDLVEREHVVESVAVVPVGISDHLRVREIRAVRPDEARTVVDSLVAWNRSFRQRLGRGFVYPSDELFLMAERRLPGEAFYDGFPQLHNGVGLTRVMLADWRRHRRRLPSGLLERRRVGWLCGRAARVALEAMVADAGAVENLDVSVHVVENTLFGRSIGVSGLMSGRDVVTTLAGSGLDLAVLPTRAFGHDGERTLDDWSVASLQEASGVPIRLASTARELIAASVA